MLLLTTVLVISIVFGACSANDHLPTVTRDDTLSACYNSSCYPHWGNLLKGRRVYANSTCGADGPEEYCLVSNERKEITCGTCDSSDPRSKHPPSYLKDRRIKSRTTWWKAVNGIDEVTLQLDLETTFQFTHLIMVFYSFRPGAMVIERSIDHGETWMPYQYFAYDCQKIFGMRERELGEQDEYGIKRHPDQDVICTSKYSKLEPAQGGEVIYKVIRGRPTTDANRPSLRKLLLLTNLRVRFVKLHTLGDDILDPNDAQAKRKYFYAVEDWVVRGSCFCNGHADHCTPMPGVEAVISEAVKNMINGSCDCQHNTAGYNCETCKDFYHKLPWQPGDPSTGQPHACQECNCYGHSESCVFDEQLYAQSGDGGRCTDCQHSTAGAHCDMCVYGYYQLDDRKLNDTDICQPCNCNEAGTSSQICASVTTDSVPAGTCICKENVAQSAKCDTCKPDHFNLDAENPLGCTACGCDTRGTINGATSCEVEGQCTCKDNVQGKACDRCMEGYFNMRSESQLGCEKCQCDTVGSRETDKCDPLTGACFCKTGFTGYDCTELLPGYYIPSMEHWKYNPEDSGYIDGDGYEERTANSSGTGYVVLPVDSSVTQNTDERAGEEEVGPDDLTMSLDTGFYDLKIYHEPADSDYSLILELDHTGKFDGTEPAKYECGYDADLKEEQPFSKQTIKIDVKAGSSVTRLEDLCMEQGSQYNVKLVLGDEGTGSLIIRDMTLIKPTEPEKAFALNSYLEDLYKQYQQQGCPMEGSQATDITNECYGLKTQIEGQLPRGTEPCVKVGLCLPDLDVWDYSDEALDFTVDKGAEIVVEEGGMIRLPSESSMLVPLDPGTAGLRELVLSHDPTNSNVDIFVDVTVTHKGNADGSSPASYRCGDKIIRPYSEITFSIFIPKNNKFTSIGEVCLDHKGDYVVKLTPKSTNDGVLVVNELFLTNSDIGQLVYPDSAELAALWDKYVAAQCPKHPGGANSDKEECVQIINQIKEGKKKNKKECVEESCIPYNLVWRPEDALDNLSEGSYVDPVDREVVLPQSGAVIEFPVSGSDSITGSLTDMVLTHDPVSTPQTVQVELVRTDSDAAYSCGILESVPSTQKLDVTLQPGTLHTVLSTFCLVADGEYELRIVGKEVDQNIKISEIGAVLPANSDAAYPDNAAAAQYFTQFIEAACVVYPTAGANSQCKHLANLVDYHSNPDRVDKQDCEIALCYPTNDVYAAGETEHVELSAGAAVDKSDGSIIVPDGGKVVVGLDPLITGPNTLVIEYDSNNPPAELSVRVIYKGAKDSSKISEYECRGETVKPKSSEHRVLIDSSETSVGLEVCMVYGGIYQLEITVVEQDKSINVDKVYVELPRNSTNIFGNNSDADELLDNLLSRCIDKDFTAECAAMSRELAAVIDDNHSLYKVNCSEELCLPEEKIWEEGDTFSGASSGTSNGGSAVLLRGEASMIFTFAGSKTPQEGLNSLIITIDPAAYKRVVDIVLKPKDLDSKKDYVSCGEVSSAKEQLLRKVIQESVVFVEVGPVCIDQELEYEIQIVYKGVQHGDKIFHQTSGINVVIHSIDAALPTSSDEAYPDHQQAADIWEQYVNLQCPRLKAGYRDASPDCYALLQDLKNVVNNVQEQECTVTVCIESDGGWKHDPTSDQEVYEHGAAVSGASKDAVIVLPPGGEVNIKTGEKETAIPAENIPRTGLMDVLINHKKSKYGWYLNVDVSHIKTKGDVIPAEYSCGPDITLQPYSSQVFKVKVPGCTTQTRLPGVCVSKHNTYSITLSVIQRLEQVEEECEGAVEVDSGFPVDEVMFTFPEDPSVAFPDSPDLQKVYEEYLKNSCPGRRSDVCDTLTVKIIAEIVGQSVSCDCDMRGSISNSCDNVGGQCPCKEGYTGRQCNLCEAGFYGIGLEDVGVCIPCNCNKFGSVSGMCDREGQCPCYPGVSDDVRDCSQCLPGYVGLGNLDMKGCVKCECGVGAALPNCDETTGMCSCHPGAAQPLCNDCLPGFYSLQKDVGCKSCGCEKAGSTNITCEQDSGMCSCKSNVVGTKCDSCKTGSYSISEENPAGCISCYCHGITDECTTAKGWSVNSDPLTLAWTVLGGHQEKRKKYVIGAVKGTEMVWQAKDVGNFYHSYSLSLQVELTGVTDQEVLLRLYRDNTYITAELNKATDKLFNIRLYEDKFETSSQAVSYNLFRYVLGDITQLEITTLYNELTRHDQKLKKFVIDRAEEGSGGVSAGNVEMCRCPAGYSGAACGSCVQGHAKKFSTHADTSVSYECVQCNVLCNGHSDSCNTETGQCYNCSQNTAGLHCDQCEEGYYPELRENNATVCSVCPCSKNAVSPSCSIGDAGVYPVCDLCEKGYTGNNCSECAPGYFGKDGSCTACQCNGNIDVSDPYSCDKELGVCQRCLYNTTGSECGACKERFYGNAKKADLPKCRACECDSVGSKSDICDNFSGLCDCELHVTGTRCDRCTAGYWNMTAGAGCESCECDSRGSGGPECEAATGQCACKPGIEGRACDTCLAGYYNTQPNSTEIVCTDCMCNSAGSTSLQCDTAGQCPCRDSVIGVQCDECARGTTGQFPDCEPCGECYDQWEKEVMTLENEIEGLAAKAQNIHLGAANLTEDQLQNIFKELKKTLKEADKLAKSSPGDSSDTKKMTETLSSMSTALQKKSKELDSLEKKLNNIDTATTETMTDLADLDQRLEEFKVATNNLAEKAMNLSAANLDEALKLVEDAAERSTAAKQRAAATKDDIEKAENRAKKAEAILADPIFSDTTSVKTLDSLDKDLIDLSKKLDKLDSKVCGSELGTCDKCGGSQCGTCGGPGCAGAVGIISSITQLADDARQCADERQRQVTEATSELRELTNQADESQGSVDKMLEVSKDTQQNLTQIEQQLQDVKTQIDEFLSSERSTADDVETLIQATAGLSLPLTEDELSKLIDDLSKALSDINRIDTDVDVSLPDKQRVADLLARAQAASSNANSTLEGILDATSALREFDENYNAAEKLFRDTSDVVNEGWSGITQTKQNTADAEAAREGVDKDLSALEKELKLLLTEIENGDKIAGLAQQEIAATAGKVKSNEEVVQRLKKDYDALDKEISQKEDVIAGQLAQSDEGAKLSADVEASINLKLEEVERLTDKYVTQQSTLVDLNSELDDLETKLDGLMEQINEKALFHAVCNTEVPAK